jgi:hypothetical protein
MRCLRNGADVNQSPFGREITEGRPGGQWGGWSGRNRRQPRYPHESDSQEDGLDATTGLLFLGFLHWRRLLQTRPADKRKPRWAGTT